MAIEQWLDSLRTNSTKKVYLAGLRDFARAIGVGIDEYETKLKAEHDPFSDLLTYASSLNGKPPTTANSYMNGVISFLEFKREDFELSKKQRRQLRVRMPKSKRTRTVEDDLTRDRLRKILGHCNTNGTALFLFLESSGIRIGESLQLTLDDVVLDSKPVKVNVRGEYTKTGDKYYSFISKEAKDALEEWLKVRKSYLVSASKRGVGLPHGQGTKSTEDNRVFPFSFTVANTIWLNALEKAGLKKQDPKTKRHTLHIHLLRKYFNSQLKLVVPSEIVEALMGHNDGLEAVYRRYTEQQIREWYLKGEPYLDVLSSEEVSRLRTHYDERIEQLRELNELRQLKVLKLEEQIEELSRFMKEKAVEVFREEFRKLYEEDREERRREEDFRKEKTKEIHGKKD